MTRLRAGFGDPKIAQMPQLEFVLNVSSSSPLKLICSDRELHWSHRHRNMPSDCTSQVRDTEPGPLFTQVDGRYLTRDYLVTTVRTA